MTKPALALMGLAFVASEVSAQLVNGRYQLPRTGTAGKQTGVQAKPAPAPAVVVMPGTLPTAVPVAVRLVPAVVMSDGTILGDFGFGLEPVRRACAAVQPQQQGGKVFIGGGQVISQPSPSTQPAPAQATASQQMSPTYAQRAPSRAAQGSCFMRDASGRAFFTR